MTEIFNGLRQFTEVLTEILRFMDEEISPIFSKHEYIGEFHGHPISQWCQKIIGAIEIYKELVTET